MFTRFREGRSKKTASIGSIRNIGSKQSIRKLTNRRNNYTGSSNDNGNEDDYTYEHYNKIIENSLLVNKENYDAEKILDEFYEMFLSHNRILVQQSKENRNNNNTQKIENLKDILNTIKLKIQKVFDSTNDYKLEDILLALIRFIRFKMTYKLNNVKINQKKNVIIKNESEKLTEGEKTMIKYFCYILVPTTFESDYNKLNNCLNKLIKDTKDLVNNYPKDKQIPNLKDLIDYFKYVKLMKFELSSKHPVMIEAKFRNSGERYFRDYSKYLFFYDNKDCTVEDKLDELKGVTENLDSKSIGDKRVPDLKELIAKLELKLKSLKKCKKPSSWHFFV